MDTALKIGITYEQLLSAVKQLSIQQKIQLTKELEQDSIETKLSDLLAMFKTDELSLETIDEEVEKLRQEIYDKQKILI